jgi:hypothetical protein
LVIVQDKKIANSVIKVILAVIAFGCSANSWEKDRSWEKKWLTSDVVADTIEGKDGSFVCEYQMRKRTMMEGDTKCSEPRITKDSVFFTFCTVSGACAYYYKIQTAGNLIRLQQECDPATEGDHIASFCVYVKMYKLKKGVYILNYGEGCKRVAIE